VKRTLIAIAAIPLVVGSACTAKTSTSTSASSPTGLNAPGTVSTTTTEAPAGPGVSAKDPAPIGTTLEVAKGWTVTVQSAERNGNATMATGDKYGISKPSAGEQFVLAKVSLTNGSDRPGSWDSNVKLSLLPPSGVAVSGSGSSGCYQAPERLESMAQLQPGATLVGNVCFEVPAADAAAAVLLAEPTFTMDEAEDQRFFSLGP
jgi:hypothetical protein